MENTPGSYHKHNGPVGLFVIAIGVMLLLKNINPTLTFGVTWPILIIAAGMVMKHRRMGGMGQ
jgi:Domain of unknown function (DUF5668)